MKKLLSFLAWLWDTLIFGEKRRLDYAETEMMEDAREFLRNSPIWDYLDHVITPEDYRKQWYPIDDDLKRFHVVWPSCGKIRFWVHMEFQAYGKAPVRLSISHNDERRYDLSDLTPLTMEEIQSIVLKATNLANRFGDAIRSFYLDGPRYEVEYQLGYEKKTFVAYYKNNNLKKKLVGAVSYVRNLESNLERLVSNVNMFYANFGSKLRLTSFYGSPDAAGLHHFRLALNDYVFIDTASTDWNLGETYEKLAKPEMENTLKGLMSKDLVKVKTADGHVFIAHQEMNTSNKFLEFRPIFPASFVEAIYTSTAFILEKFEQRTLHHGSVSMSNMQKDLQEC